MRCGDNERRKSVKRTSVILIISLLLLLTGAVGSTMAYIKDAAGQVTNTFIPAEVIIDINENVRENRFKENHRSERFILKHMGLADRKNSMEHRRRQYKR